MSGAIPLYLNPKYNGRLALWAPLSQTTVEACISAAVRHQLEPRLLILTNCTYDGVLLPIHELAAFAHHQGLVVHADEAWFPYGRFHPYYGSGPSAGRYNALDAGADFCVHSSHKVLAAFSQASMLHVHERFRDLFEKSTRGTRIGWVRDRFRDYEAFEHQLIENLRFWLSTSPHYPMIATLDAAAAQMGIEGPLLLTRLLGQAHSLHDWAKSNGCAIELKDIVGGNMEGYENYGFDPLKFSIAIRSGCLKTLKERLADSHQYEKSTSRSMLFLLTVGTQRGQVEGLKAKLASLSDCLGGSGEGEDARYEVTGQAVLIPRDAHYANGTYLSLSDARKRCEEGEELIACHMVTPYPPGIPLLLPGLKITVDAIDAIRGQRGEDIEVHGLRAHNGDQWIRVILHDEQDKILKRCSGDAEAILRKLCQVGLPA